MKFIFLLFCAACASAMAGSPLAEAVRKGVSSNIQTLLTNKENINAPGPDGMTALHWAAQNNDTQTAELLLQAGADAKAANRYGITPLWLACRNGNSSLTRLLIKAGADPNNRQAGGDTPLMIAARSGSLETVSLLLEAGADVNARENGGQTAVMWAAAEGHAPVVQAFIDRGAEFRKPLNSGFTPLFFAIRDGHAQAAKTLLKAGADVNEAMQPARRAGRGPQAGYTPLLMAVENGHFELAIDLVKAGADPNHQGAGYAALHCISWVRKPDHGEGEDGAPPPAGSGKIGSLEFVRQTVKLGADVNLRVSKGKGGLGVLNPKGATPFFLAAKTADLALLKLLLELGADPSINNADGVTPLIAAAGLGTLAAGEVAGTEEEVVEVLDWLLKNGADINAVDNQGETAMHAASYKNLPKAVEFLASKGARIEVWNQKNKHGWTPLLIAEGFRPGNFKPSFETIASFHKVMLAAGIAPPPPTKADGINNSDFGPREKKYPDKEPAKAP